MKPFSRLVVLDLETTGLDATRDAIIDYGFLVYDASGSVQEYSGFLRPGIPLPPVVQQLTGITEDMLAHAPLLSDVRPSLEPLLKNAVLVGHNISFDLGFLSRAGFSWDGPVFDTVTLASMLLPGEASYSLQALAAAHNIAQPMQHRALADAKATALLFQLLCARADALPHALLEEIRTFLSARSWNEKEFFLHAEGKDEENDIQDISSSSPLSPSSAHHASRSISQIFDEGRDYAAETGYTVRPAQRAMAEDIAKIIEEKGCGFFEGETGVGKTLAYLVATSTAATHTKKRVCIATHTKTLQDQILSKDIPLCEKLLGYSLHAVVLKGRRNYLCEIRLQQFCDQETLQQFEITALVKLLILRSTTKTGGLSEMRFFGREWFVVSHVSSHMLLCGGHTEQDGCWYARARAAAERADIVIVNHALLALLREETFSLDILVVDEAHHLEDALTHALERALEERSLDESVRTLFSLSVFPREWKKHLDRLQKEYAELFEMLMKFFTTMSASTSSVFRPQTLRVTPLHASSREWKVQTEKALQLREHLRILAGMVRDLLPSTTMQKETYRLREAIETLEEMRECLTMYDHTSSHVVWLRIAHEKTDEHLFSVSLHEAPRTIHPALEDLRQRVETLLLTSATLTIDGSYTYIKGRLGIGSDAKEYMYASPFSYPTHALFYTITDMPLPNDGHFFEATAQAISAIADAATGRTLVLFTSHDALRRVAEYASPLLAQKQLLLLGTGRNESPDVLLREFVASRSRPTIRGAVLFGTQRFWEGIDIPGDPLSCIIIPKLPFAVPSDPLVEIRSEAYSNPFQEWSVPDAILRLKQGVGRLLRHPNDHGAVVFLDARLVRSRYGERFFHSLPPATKKQGTLSSAPDSIRSWLKTS